MTVIRGKLFAWRKDGTTSTITADTVDELRAALIADLALPWLRIPLQRPAQ